MIAIPSAVKAFNYITTIWKGNIQFNPAMLFAIGLVSTFITGGLTGIILGDSALDINLHDTYFVVAHFHLVMGISALYGLFAGVYHWYPRMFGRMIARINKIRPQKQQTLDVQASILKSRMLCRFLRMPHPKTAQHPSSFPSLPVKALLLHKA